MKRDGKDDGMNVEKSIKPIELCNGDLILIPRNNHTILQLIAPVSIRGKREVKIRGNYAEWNQREWKLAKKRAKQFEPRYPNLANELARIESTLREKRMEGELWVVDVDRITGSPHLHALHTLGISFSRKHNHIRVHGSDTYRNRTKLRSLGLLWDPDIRAWWTEFSEEKLNEVVDFLKLHDQKQDPVKTGHVQCSVCNKWIPEGTTCPCSETKSKKTKETLETVTVEFLEPFGRSYKKGDRGSLPREQALKLVKEGIVKIEK